ncbi:MAG: TetR family transcriptional regulator C-terminal domain-containing protein [Blastomonas sp.]
MARPQNYELNSVVRKARDLFWAEGFGACDVGRLVHATGLNRHSLYGSLGGKSGLFQMALSHYVDTIAAEFIAALDDGTGLSAIRAYFEKARSVLTQSGTDKASGNGCFVTNTVIELGETDSDVNAIVAKHYAAMENGFRRALWRGMEDGSIRTDLDIDDMAQWLVITSQGLSVSARFGMTDHNIVRAIDQALSPDTGDAHPDHNRFS